jgi:hypothetical protein
VSARGRDALTRTEREILAEKAASLGRAGERLERALAEVAAIGARLDVAPDPGEAAVPRAAPACHQATDGARLAALVTGGHRSPRRRSPYGVAAARRLARRAARAPLGAQNGSGPAPRSPGQ